MSITPELLSALAQVLTPIAVIVTGVIGYANNRALRSISTTTVATHTLVDGQATQTAALIADLTTRVAGDNPRDANAQIAASSAVTNLNAKQASDAASNDSAKHST
jgi:hypothetical protein